MHYTSKMQGIVNRPCMVYSKYAL